MQARQTAPAVSVIIPTYNRADLITAAIDSVLAQTFGDLEVIVVDDGSTDDTRAVVSGMSDRLRYAYLHHTGLSGVVRNHGIGLARGGFIAFLDSDDLWLPTMLATYLGHAASHPEFGMVYGNGIYFDGMSGQDLYAAHHYVRPHEGWIAQAMINQMFVLTSGVLVRRAVLDHVGMFSGEPAMRFGEDWDLWLRIAARYQIGLVAAPLVRIRLHDASITAGGINPLDLHDHVISLIDQACRFAPEVYEPVRKSALIRQYFRTLELLSARGRTDEARQVFTRAMQLDGTLSLQLLREAKSLRAAAPEKA